MASSFEFGAAYGRSIHTPTRYNSPAGSRGPIRATSPFGLRYSLKGYCHRSRVRLTSCHWAALDESPPALARLSCIKSCPKSSAALRPSSALHSPALPRPCSISRTFRRPMAFASANFRNLILGVCIGSRKLADG